MAAPIHPYDLVGLDAAPVEIRVEGGRHPAHRPRNRRSSCGPCDLMDRNPAVDPVRDNFKNKSTDAFGIDIRGLA